MGEALTISNLLWTFLMASRWFLLLTCGNTGITAHAGVLAVGWITSWENSQVSIFVACIPTSIILATGGCIARKSILSLHRTGVTLTVTSRSIPRSAVRQKPLAA